VSKIQDFSHVFAGSYYNGDLSKWKFNHAKFFIEMFAKSDFNNDSLRCLDFEKIINAGYMFYKSKFCGDISNWINYDNTILDNMFYLNENFKNKYNNGENIPEFTNNWIKNHCNYQILNYFEFEEKDINFER